MGQLGMLDLWKTNISTSISPTAPRTQMASTPVSAALLLDLDGVVFKHPAAFALLHRRVEAFVASRVNLRSVAVNSCEDAPRGLAELHNTLYREHGHTLLGLRARFGDASTISDFNRFVFDAPFYEHVRALPLPNDAAIHARNVRSLVAHARRRSVPVFIFTNAPRDWVRFALSTTGLASVFEPANVLVAEELGFIKPEPGSYVAASACVRQRVLSSTVECERCVFDADASANFRVVFVDDSVVNIAASPLDWMPVFYAPSAPYVHDVLPPPPSSHDECDGGGGVGLHPAWWVIRDLDKVTRFI